MRRGLLLMAGVALTTLFFALNTVPVQANACDDQYWACMQDCESNPYPACSLDCLCGYAACQDPQDPPPQGCGPPG